MGRVRGVADRLQSRDVVALLLLLSLVSSRPKLEQIGRGCCWGSCRKDQFLASLLSLTKTQLDSERSFRRLEVQDQLIP